jgi:hypothetical protein
MLFVCGVAIWKVQISPCTLSRVEHLFPDAAKPVTTASTLVGVSAALWGFRVEVPQRSKKRSRRIEPKGCSGECLAYNAPGKSGNAPAPRNDQRTCHQCGQVGHIKRTCPELNSCAIVNARYANAPAKQKGQDLSNVECYTCHKKGHYFNKCPDRQPGTAFGTRQDGKPWCSHHQANMHNTEECWHLHPT